MRRAVQQWWKKALVGHSERPEPRAQRDPTRSAWAPRSEAAYSRAVIVQCGSSGAGPLCCATFRDSQRFQPARALNPSIMGWPC